MASPIQEATELVEDLFQHALKNLGKTIIHYNERAKFITVGAYKIYKNKDDFDLTIIHKSINDYNIYKNEDDFTVIHKHTKKQSMENSLYHCINYIIYNEMQELFECRYQQNLRALTKSISEGNNENG